RNGRNVADEIEIELVVERRVGAGKQHGRDAEAKYLGGLKVDDKLKFGRTIDWQIRWRFALENASSIDASPAISICCTGRIAHQTACLWPHALRVDARDGVALSERNDLVSMGGEERTRPDEQGTHPLIRERAEAGIDLVSGACIQDAKALSGVFRNSLDFRQLVCHTRKARVHQTSYYRS